MFVAPEAEFDNIENIKKAVEVGAGIALLPEPTLRRESHAGTLVAVPLDGCRFVRPLAIIHRAASTSSRGGAWFMELLRNPETHELNSETNHKAAPGRNARVKKKV